MYTNLENNVLLLRPEFPYHYYLAKKSPTKSFVEKLKKSPLVLLHASNFLMRSVIHQCFIRSLQEVIFVKNS